MTGWHRLRIWLRYPLRHKAWAIRNWINGYQFSRVQRFRCCEHTTPYHYAWCDRWTHVSVQRRNGSTDGNP